MPGRERAARVAVRVALCLFRIVQEGLNNVDKHSGAREAEVTLTRTSGTLLVTIADSGRGFDEAAASVQGGLGLASMRERVQLVGGEMTLSIATWAARVIVRAPITEVSRRLPARLVASRDGYDAAPGPGRRGRAEWPRGLSKRRFVDTREAPELEEPVVCGNGRDCAARTVGPLRARRTSVSRDARQSAWGSCRVRRRTHCAGCAR